MIFGLSFGAVVYAALEERSYLGLNKIDCSEHEQHNEERQAGIDCRQGQVGFGPHQAHDGHERYVARHGCVGMVEQ